jgi:endogenous inhibitor of DNA gyrase (YacG/DUF329 family)
MTDRPPPVTPVRSCPICGKPAAAAAAPFCSARCADVDLHRWLNGSYALPAAPAAEDGDEDEEAAADRM